MRLQVERTGFLPGQAYLTCYPLLLPQFELYWHHHTAYELTCITAGYGRRLVGDHLDSFDAGDCVLLGPQLPHSWVSDTQVAGPVSAWVLQFSPAYVQALLALPGMQALHTLLQQAGRGLFLGKYPPGVVPCLEQLHHLPPGPAQAATLLQLAQHLLQQPAIPLASPAYAAPAAAENMQSRLHTLLHWLHGCFTTPQATLAQGAALLHLQQSAFCKFFKRHTGKAFTAYVNELRIAYACRLLAETDDTIARIAYAAGYENLSYFNRMFLHYKKITPAKFRTAHRLPAPNP